MDIGIVLSFAGVLLTAAAFIAGRQTAANQTGRETGTMGADIRYIKESIERIEQRLSSDIKRVEGRIDILSAQQLSMAEKVSLAQEAAKNAHSKVEEHLAGEHAFM